MTNTSPRSVSASGYIPRQSEVLDAEASEFLRKAGFRADGRPRGEGSVSVKAVSTPCGGKTAWKRDK